MRIYVNDKPHNIEPANEMLSFVVVSFEQICELAEIRGQGVTVAYQKGSIVGSLAAGETVGVEAATKFVVEQS